MQWARSALQARQQVYSYARVAAEVTEKATEATQQKHAASTWAAYDGIDKCFYHNVSGVGTTFVPCGAPEMRCQVSAICKRSYRNAERRPTAADLRACTNCPAYCHESCTEIPASSSDGKSQEAFLCHVCAKNKRKEEKPIPPCMAFGNAGAQESNDETENARRRLGGRMGHGA